MEKLLKFSQRNVTINTTAICLKYLRCYATQGNIIDEKGHLKYGKLKQSIKSKHSHLWLCFYRLLFLLMSNGFAFN